MTSLPDRFIEDRALRDAARAVLAEDLDKLRDSLGEEGLASRVTASVGGTISGRIRDGARDLLEQAKRQADDHRGVLAVLLGAIILWFGRGPILALFGVSGDDEDAASDDDTEPAPPSRSRGDIP
jgi:hypothetical protein